MVFGLGNKRQSKGVERQELWCHDCEHYVQFDLDMSLNGNHVLECPNCGHEHCRVVKDGVITSERWDSRNGPPIYVTVTTITYSTNSTWETWSSSASTTGDVFLYSAWMNRS